MPDILRIAAIFLRGSYQRAYATVLLLNYWLGLCLEHHAHCLVENLLQALLGQSTTLHILALELLFDDLAGRLLADRCFFRVLLLRSKLIPQVNLVPDKNLGDVSYTFLELRVPLSFKLNYFLASVDE